MKKLLTILLTSLFLVGNAIFLMPKDILADDPISLNNSYTVITIDGNPTDQGYSYTGSEIKPEVTVKYAGSTLTEDSDYTLTYSHNISCSTADQQAVITVTGKGNFTGSKTKNFHIYPAKLELVDGSLNTSLVYNGSDQELIDNAWTITAPEGVPATVSYGLLTGTNTTPSVSYTNKTKIVGKEAGDYKIYIQGLTDSNHKVDPTTKTVSIAKRTPEVTFTAANFATGLVYDNRDQELIATAATPDTVDNNDVAGGNCVISYAVSSTNTVPSKDATDTWETDYTKITKKDAGTYYIFYKVTGTDNFNDVDPSLVGSVVIAPYTVTTTSPSASTISGYTYDTNAKEPTPTLTFKNSKSTDQTLVLDTDYSLTYGNNINATSATSKAKVTVTYKGNFTGTQDIEFEIDKADPTVTFSDKTETYNGSNIDVSASYTLIGTDTYDQATIDSITLKYYKTSVADNNLTEDHKDAGTYKVQYKIPETSNYNDVEETVTLTINAASANNLTYDFSNITGGTYTYNKSEIKPTETYTVKLSDSVVCVEGTDYDVSYTNNTNAGTATMTLTFKGNYTGTKDVNFTILPLNVNAVDGSSNPYVTIDSISAQTYNKAGIEPSLTVKHSGDTLTKDTDYKVTYSNNTNATTAESKAKATIEGKGNYTGTKDAEFVINPCSLDSADITIETINDQEYTGSAIEPTLTVKQDGASLTLTTDYTVAYDRNTNVTSATATDAEKPIATITGNGNYTGSKSAYFKIVAKDITNDTSATLSLDTTSYTYDGSAHKPTPTLHDVARNIDLTNSTDYTYKYYDAQSTEVSEPTKAGTYTVKVTGTGNYKGEKSTTFTIDAYDIETKDGDNYVVIISSISNQEYDGTAKTPTVTVTHGSALTSGATNDYTVSYSNNTNAGTATVTISGVNNYKGTRTVNFTIDQFDITKKSDSTNYDITIGDITNQTYTGSGIKPGATLTRNTTTLVEDTDYEITYTNNTTVGTATETIEGKGNYKGTRTTTFTIEVFDITTKSDSTNYDITIDDIDDQTYTGSEIKPEPVVKDGSTTLIEDTDYTVAYDTNTNAGTSTAKVTITGKNNYSGERTVYFTITPYTLTDSDVSLTTTSYAYKENSDGSAKAITPTPTVTFGTTTLDTTNDYDLTYTNNTAVGEDTAKVTVTGKGNFTGTVDTTFTITKATIDTVDSITWVDHTETDKEYTYTGSKIVPSFVITNGDYTLIEGTDYTVTTGEDYIDVKENATVRITFNRTNYEGYQDYYFDIVPMPIDCVITVNDATYLGVDKEVKPEVTVTYGNPAVTLLSTDYDLVYSDNKVAGTAKVTVTPKGNYKGNTSTSFSKNFTVLPKALTDADVEFKYGSLNFDNSQHKHTGSALTPEPVITYNGDTLVKDSDYTIIGYTNNTDVSTDQTKATLTIEGKGNYDATEAKRKVLNFVIIADPVNAYQNNDGSIRIEGSKSALEKVASKTDSAAKITLKYSDTNSVEITNYNNTNKPIVVEGNDNDGYYVELDYSDAIRTANRQVVKGIDGQYPATTPGFTVKLDATDLSLSTSGTIDTTRGQETVDIKEELLAFDSSFVAGTTKIYVNGVETTNTVITIDDYRDVVIQTYKYNKDISEIDSRYYTEYDTYLLTQDKNAVGGWAKLEHLDELDDVMKFAGAQVRIVEPNGIRFLTSITKDNFNKLTSSSVGLGNNKDGSNANDFDIKYNIIQFGTILAWTDTTKQTSPGIGEQGQPTLRQLTAGDYVYDRETSGTRKGEYYSATNTTSIYAYDKDLYNKNWAYQSDATKWIFSNYMTEKVTPAATPQEEPTYSWSGRYEENVATRAYMVLRPIDGPSDGSQDIVIYGGTVYRSVVHVADSILAQNYYATTSDAYKYIKALADKRTQQPQ